MNTEHHFCYGCFCECTEQTDICPNCGYNPAENRENYPQALPQGYQLLDMYIVGRVLGQGGYGITYLGMETKTGDKVAIKEYFPRASALRSHVTCKIEATSMQTQESFQKGKEDFLREARVLVKFAENPNIVGIRGCFEANGTAYIVMEYIEGITFQQYIAQKGGKISWKDACDKLMPVIKELEEVHKTGIIHRDIAPDNIYVTSDNMIKLLDFGAARQQSLNQTHSMEEILKRGYAPIEQYSRRGKQGPFTDIYALCACFYYAVTGKIPPDATERSVKETLDSFTTLKVKVPHELEAVIYQGLTIDYENRYQNMTELRNAIEAAMKPKPIFDGKWKKFVWMIPVLLVILGGILLKPDSSYSRGLEFSEITDADGNIVYEVADIGSCMDLQVIIPDTYKGKPVVSIQKYAFCGDDFEEIIIPDSIYCIDERAFYECTKLKEIVIPSSVKTIANEAFYGCENLEKIIISEGVTTIGAYAFQECRNLKEIEIPSSVVTIGQLAFSNCVRLTNVMILPGLTEIENRVFQECSSLTTIEIPNSVTAIGMSAFEHCVALTEINIPSSVTTIGPFVFSGCESLTEIWIPSSVTDMNHSAFLGSDITTIYCEADSQPVGWEEDWNAVDSIDKANVIWGYQK